MYGWQSSNTSIWFHNRKIDQNKSWPLIFLVHQGLCDWSRSSRRGFRRCLWWWPKCSVIGSSCLQLCYIFRQRWFRATVFLLMDFWEPTSEARKAHCLVIVPGLAGHRVSFRSIKWMTPRSPVYDVAFEVVIQTTHARWLVKAPQNSITCEPTAARYTWVLAPQD